MMKGNQKMKIQKNIIYLALAFAVACFALSPMTRAVTTSPGGAVFAQAKGQLAYCVTDLGTATHHSLAAEAERMPNLEKALAVYTPRPKYPYEAHLRRQTGTGVAVLMVDPSTGVVKNAEMEVSTGHEILDNAALSTFRRWQFKPGTVSKVHVPVTFTMGGRVDIALKVTEIKDVDSILAPFLGRGTLLSAPQPRYPVHPLWTNKEGKGIYEMRVRKDGKVEDVRILKSSGDPTFDHITVDALRRWRLRRGPMTIELPLAFRLTPRTFDFWVAKK
jgi:TonB family protein